MLVEKHASNCSNQVTAVQKLKQIGFSQGKKSNIRILADFRRMKNRRRIRLSDTAWGYAARDALSHHMNVALKTPGVGYVASLLVLWFTNDKCRIVAPFLGVCRVKTLTENFLEMRRESAERASDCIAQQTMHCDSRLL